MASIFRSPGYGVGAILAAALLTGCGGSQPPIGIPGAPSAVGQSTAESVGSNRSKQLLYVAENTESKVDVYDARKYKAGPIADITDGIDDPVGLCFGADGVLYVANNGSDSISSTSRARPSRFRRSPMVSTFPNSARSIATATSGSPTSSAT